MESLKTFCLDDSGAVAAEFNLLLAFIAVILASVVGAFGLAVKNLFTLAVTRFP
jgi:Flp pilus assembly pilin Flp